MSRTQVAAACLLCACLGYVAGVADSGAEATPPPEAWESLSLFSEVYSNVQSRWYQEPDQQALVAGAINGMMGSLDNFSRFLPAEQFSSFQDSTDGEYVGVGIQVQTSESGQVVIGRVLPGGPALDAGVQDGDRIVGIDEHDVSESDLRDVVALLRGERGQPVLLTVERAAEDDPQVVQRIEFTIVRDAIHTIAVNEELMDDGFGVVRVSVFSGGVSEDIRAAIDRLQTDAGGDLRGIVLDLRGNPGGLVSEAIGTINLFLDEGLIVSMSSRDPGESRRWTADRNSTRYRGPLVVLMDGGSASASELVAGAIQDHARGPIIGTQSFGKGSVQSIIPLTGGAGMRLTIALYYTPDGRSIHGEGITPDINVSPGSAELPESEGAVADPVLRAGISYLRTLDANGR